MEYLSNFQFLPKLLNYAPCRLCPEGTQSECRQSPEETSRRESWRVIPIDQDENRSLCLLGFYPETRNSGFPGFRFSGIPVFRKNPEFRNFVISEKPNFVFS